ncbi:permease [Actinocrispum sp. NPDC049592]|uniref:permease n=1 Tax=Actinocrispum sp. NPDC049592 TaxID=3154835 RepID=UPI003415C6CB
MIAGHFGFAAAVKASQTRIPLWTLMLATVWLDVVFAPLLAFKVETLDPLPGTDGGYGEAVIHADYTHSLVGSLVLAAIFGAVAAWRLGRRAGLILGGVVFSHWVLDLVVHRMDLPLLPGNAGDLPKLGFGLWRVPAASVAVEVLLMAIGFGLYWRAAARVDAKRARTAGIAMVLSGIVTIVADLAFTS